MKISNLVELTCLEVTELMTDYMSAKLPPADRVQFEQHLYACTWCMTYLTQMRRSVDWAKEVPEPEAPNEASREALRTLFRRWKDEQAP